MQGTVRADPLSESISPEVLSCPEPQLSFPTCHVAPWFPGSHLQNQGLLSPDLKVSEMLPNLLQEFSLRLMGRAFSTASVLQGPVLSPSPPFLGQRAQGQSKLSDLTFISVWESVTETQDVPPNEEGYGRPK